MVSVAKSVFYSGEINIVSIMHVSDIFCNITF